MSVSISLCTQSVMCVRVFDNVHNIANAYCQCPLTHLMPNILLFNTVDASAKLSYN